MTDAEMRSRLRPILGVYGDWLVKHGKSLDKKDELVQRIIRMYALFHTRCESASIVLLMAAIDDFCSARNFEKPASSLVN